MRYWIILPFLFLSLISSVAQVNLALESAEVSAGESFCLDLTVEGFTDVLSIQFRTLWDTTLLSFDSTTNLGVEDNGLIFSSKTDELRFTWIASDFFTGASLDTGAVLFSICFTALKDGAGLVEIDENRNVSENPVPPEIADLSGREVEGITYIKGTVTIFTGMETDPMDTGDEGTGMETDSTDTSGEGTGMETDPMDTGDEGTGMETDSTDTGDEGTGMETDPMDTDGEGTGMETDSTDTDGEGTGMEMNPTNTPVNCAAVEVFVEQLICEGQRYEGYDESGNYTDIFTTKEGCDSTRNLRLLVSNRVRTQVDTSICAGGMVAGQTEKGSYIDIFTSEAGCDSIRVLNLFILSDGDAACSTTSVIDLEEDNTFTIIPNPVQNHFTIDVLSIDNLPATISLYNIQGQLQFSDVLSGPQTSFSAGQLVGGMYILVIDTEAGQFVKRIVKM